jgi:DNA repair protein RecN (Recombination protein N)
MLNDLLIKNYALIEQLKLQPHASLNMITGETGAGKSIMLGAIGLLLGNRADFKALLDPNEKCVVEASFLVWSYNLQNLFATLDVDYQDETTIRREIAPGGKSRAFINDTPVTLETLKQIGTRLIDIHSQHDNLLLSDHVYQLSVVDAFADNQELIRQYKDLYQKYNQLKNQYKKLIAEHETIQKEFDYNSFLLEELAKANFQPHEQEELEAELKLLESAEEVKTKLNLVLGFLSLSENATNDELRGMVNALGSIAHLSPAFENLRSRLESAWIELQDISLEISREEEKIEFSPERIELVSQRLSLIYNLQQKHHVGKVQELLDIQQNLQEKVDRVQNFDAQIAEVRVELDQAYQVMFAQAQQVSASRIQIAPQIENEIKELLQELGMPNGVMQITREEIEPTPEGIDLMSFLFSANKGIAPQEISKVASGGEFSRLMLALKYILAGKAALPTLIFDEIDTGISGEIALKMGNMFKTMARKHQIIVITHLHQIAAKGDHHYFVYKEDTEERTISRIRQLSNEERVHQIAQMISGASPTESAILSAKELLEME